MPSATQLYSTERKPKEARKVVYLRLPRSLKNQIVKAAKASGLSTNEWLVRCFSANV